MHDTPHTTCQTHDVVHAAVVQKRPSTPGIALARRPLPHRRDPALPELSMVQYGPGPDPSVLRPPRPAAHRACAAVARSSGAPTRRGGDGTAHSERSRSRRGPTLTAPLAP